ncbi:MAG: S41 family peptidase [Salinivirgaceae bacterium]|jgi:carboxyl-terminal processing protease|nr:S41 family peptidase [Salinivirgaceae bacterium]
MRNRQCSQFQTLTIGLVIIFASLFNSTQAQIFDDEIYKFAKTFSIIEQNYVDSVDRPHLLETAIVKMLEELDPHSVYISKEDLKKMNEPLEGSFDGIGIQFNILRDTLMVVATITGGPSEKVGLMAGDQIIEVDSEEIAGMGIKNSDVFDLLRGKKGTKVEVKVKRQGLKKPIDFTITRGKIPINSLDAAYSVDESTIYVKINRFSATTMNEYKEYFKKVSTKKTKNLILDLTANGGGYLKTAIDLADEFLSDDKMIVYTEGLNADKEDYRSSSSGFFKEGKVVIMIDEGSASASEIVSGAIQDWDRGVIVGRRSFGKGLVQKPFMLPDGSAMRLTIARYHTPSGRVIQKPYDKGVKKYRRDLLERYEHGEFMHQDSIDFPDSLTYKTLTNKRTVYGGGGVMPDVFVPIDTTHYSDFYRDLIRKGIFNQFILSEVNSNRTQLLEEYPDFKSFKANYTPSQKFYEKLLAYAKDKKVEPENDDLERSEDAIKQQIKALVARNLYGYHEFFELINPLDPIYLKAVEIITDDKTYNTILHN